MKSVCAFQIKLEFEKGGFKGEGKTRVPGEKPLGVREKTNNKLNPRMALTPGFEPGPHWWEMSTLTTAPSFLTNIENQVRYRALPLLISGVFLSPSLVKC